MKNKNTAFKVAEYLFHLNNANDENGIMPKENWKLETLPLEQKLAIEHAYYPTVCVEIDPKEVEDFSNGVLLGLKASYPKINIKDGVIENKDGATYFVAYSPDRVRR